MALNRSCKPEGSQDRISHSLLEEWQALAIRALADPHVAVRDTSHTRSRILHSDAKLQRLTRAQDARMSRLEELGHVARPLRPRLLARTKQGLYRLKLQSREIMDVRELLPLVGLSCLEGRTLNEVQGLRSCLF